MSDHIDEPVHHPSGAAARLLHGVTADGGVDLSELSKYARVPVMELQACRDTDERLSPEKQMRIAAAVMTLAPQHARAATALYRQAQAALRFAAAEVQSHTDYPGPGIARCVSLGGAPPSTAELEDAWTAGATARTDAGELARAAQRLRTEAHRLLAEHQSKATRYLETMRGEVEGYARVLRASGAPPERALVLVKEAVQLLIARAPLDGEVAMEQIVRWFVESYYAA